MSRQSAIVSAAVVASLIALIAGLWGLRREPAHPAASSGPAPTRVTPLVPAAPPIEAPPTPPRAPADLPSPGDPASLDEATLMATLRELRSSDPPRTLSLARQGNARFPNSRDAAEREWFVVKALTDLGQHDEARAAGRALVDRYRDTRFAEDVHRHLFVNPGTHPSERGFGKQLETDP